MEEIEIPPTRAVDLCYSAVVPAVFVVVVGSLFKAYSASNAPSAITRMVQDRDR